MKYRKILMAAMIMAPLALSACGSDEKSADSSADKNSASAVSASNSATATTEQPQSSTEAQKGNSASEGSSSPLPPEATAAPVPSHEGSDQQQIESLVNGMNVGDNMSARFHYVADNYCEAYLEPRGGAAGFRAQADSFVINGKPVTVSETGQEIPTVKGVTNVKVDGDKATGDIQSSQGSYPMQFTREGGAWKICPSS
ncbi:hypothetical protein [Corynebacterium anserum]|uniref:Lipoprotein n=1 Tax=Corynebacterium anserum TaxID=2684406 RepID=A0A7G7YN15_9CORY|nr:hypothetical protein [Corynebacterium anserum]QNH95885.1 hypothetical protein GP473_03610 [Corynebacterium anserum]